MAPSVTATLHGSGRAVSLSVNADGAAFYTVYRIVGGFDPAGPEPRFCVRGMRNVASADYTTCYDVDFPQNVALAYKVVTYDTDGSTVVATSAASSTISAIDLGYDYILGSSTDAIGVPVLVEPLDSWTRPTKSEVVKVRGRRDPVTITDRRQYPTFGLSVWTLGETARQDMEDTVNRYPVLTFSPRYPQDYMGQANAIHVTVADADEQTPGRNDAVERRWVLSCSQVGAPYTPRCTTLPTAWTTPADIED